MRYFICSWNGNTYEGKSASGNSSFGSKDYPQVKELQKAVALKALPTFKIIPDQVIFYSIWEISEQDYKSYNGSQTNSPVDAGEQLSGSDKREVQSDIEVQQGSDGKGDGSDDAGTKTDSNGERPYIAGIDWPY